MTDFLTMDQTAELLQVNRKSVAQWVRDGTIPFTRLPSGHVRFARSDLTVPRLKPLSRRRFGRNVAMGGAGLAATIAGTAPAADAATTDGSLTYDSFGSVAALNTWMAAKGSGSTREEVVFGNAPRKLTEPIGLYSGNRLIGTRLPAREFSTGAVWQASGLPSFFKQVTNSQSYPVSTGPRDFTVSGVQFAGSAPVLPSHSGSFVANDSVYYTEFRDCGFSGTPLLTHGWCDGLTLSGTTHVNSMADTFLRVGGSIMMLGMGGGMSYMDSNNATWRAAGKPFIETWATQWKIGNIEISSRQAAYALLVSGGQNGRCDGAFFDAPSDSRTLGAAVRVTGGVSLLFSGGCWFHNNRGIELISGASEVRIGDTIFQDCDGVLTAQAAFTGKVFLDGCVFAGTPKVVKVARLNQIVCNDPRIEIRDLSGNVLKKATA
jgi:excisionase family DNA binding protein